MQVSDYSTVFMRLSLSIAPLQLKEEFLISQPFSGFQYITKQIGIPILIQRPLFLYHHDTIKLINN